VLRFSRLESFKVKLFRLSLVECVDVAVVVVLCGSTENCVTDLFILAIKEQQNTLLFRATKLSIARSCETQNKGHKNNTQEEFICEQRFCVNNLFARKLC